jgi:long-chain acyl-CoA synthetase
VPATGHEAGDLLGRQGLWNYNEPWLISFAEVQELGRKLAEQEPDRFETEVRLGRGEETAVLCYTSGTTGLPKGAMLSHHNLMTSSQLFQEVDPRRDTDNHVSLLPLGWIGEHALGIAPHCIHRHHPQLPREAGNCARKRARNCP